MKKTILILIAALVTSGPVFAAGIRYEVTVTNVTSGQAFTPIIAATHSGDLSFLELGEPASEELEMLAEGGNTMPLNALWNSMSDKVANVVTTAGLLGPGESVTFDIDGTFWRDRLSFAAMLLPTHDTFVALNSMQLPRGRSGASTVTAMAVAYDAGTELNDESCANIPGPYCKGAAVSEENGEGFIHIANGIHGGGDLAPALFDWRNPVATVSIRRVKY